MARRKKTEESSGGGSGWLGTFADLMNLLLCFFVLLFSMSTVDADKYEAIVTSLSSSIDIFDGGSQSVGDGAFVSSGADQMVSIAQYFNKFEESGSSDEEKQENQTSTNPQDKNQDQNGNNESGGADSNNNGQSEKTQEEQIKDKMQQEQKRKTEELYEEIQAKATEQNVAEVVNVNMDAQYQYVQISLKGGVLFDSGQADIKSSAVPVINKIGDILKLYKKNLIKIEGHTDNVPITSPKYRNNMELSTARAGTVFEYLVKKKGLNPKRIEVAGRGEYTPTSSNKTAKGRSQNRRIEIKIYTTE